MSEKTEDKKEVKKKPEMKSVAVGFYKKDNKWNIVRIKFDLDSGQVGDVKLEEQEDLGIGIERLNIVLDAEIIRPQLGE